MRVIAYDPFLTEKRALDLGVEKVELDELLARADIITLHTPLTEPRATSSRARRSRAPSKACASSTAPAAAWSTRRRCSTRCNPGHVAGAALDVFEVEPAKESPLFGLENVVCTPHLGASTAEAQENVALQVAEQISDFLLTGAVTNAINMPSVSRRGRAAPEALHGAVPPARRLRRPADGGAGRRAQAGGDRIRRRGGDAEPPAADRGGARRPARRR